MLLRRKETDVRNVKKGSTDLTQGNSVRLILNYALPILLGQVFQNLYNSVDSIVAGNFAGTTALAAVTSCSDISNLLVGFFTGLSTGAGVLFARFYGAKNWEKLHDSIHTTLTFSVILGAAMALAGILLTPFLLTVVDCPADVWGEAELYLRIYLVGILFTSIYNVASGVLRAVGNSRDPFLYLVAASCTNIALDLLLVGGLRMGVAGAAIATIISQLLSVFLVFWNMLRTEDVYRLVLRDLRRMDRSLLLEVLDLGLPAAVQTCLVSVSNLFVQRYVNQFGSLAMAGIGAAKKVDKYVGLISNSIGLSATTFVSQNLGAGNVDRAKKGSLFGVLSAMAAAELIGVIMYIFIPQLLKLFISDPEAISYGITHARIDTLFYCMLALAHCAAGILRGCGKSTVPMVVMLGCWCVLRSIYVTVILRFIHEFRMISWAYPLTWTVSCILFVIYLFRLNWDKAAEKL